MNKAVPVSYTHLNWTSDDHINGMIRDLVMNFIKKYKELDA